MKLETIIYIFIAVAIAIGAFLLGKLIFDKPIDYSRIDSLSAGIKRNNELIESLNRDLQNNETGVEVHRHYYLQKREEIAKQKSNEDYNQIKRFLDTL